MLILFFKARFPLAAIETAIESIATYTNYGLDKTDFSAGLPEGVTDIPTVHTLSFEVDKESYTDTNAFIDASNISMGS